MSRAPQRRRLLRLPQDGAGDDGDRDERRADEQRATRCRPRGRRRQPSQRSTQVAAAGVGRASAPVMAGRVHRRASGFGLALQPLQIGPDLGRRLIARLAILLERLGDDPIELRRQIGVQLATAAAASWSGSLRRSRPSVGPANAWRPVAIS